jgi:hypothetical protein
MANIVKITEVYLYMGFTTPESAAECVKVRAMLDDNGIKYQTLHYPDNSQHDACFSALSTWVFGPSFRQIAFKDFPIVHWKEFYDDWERHIEVVQSATELASSNLILHKDKVIA